MKPYFFYGILLLTFKVFKTILVGNAISDEITNCILNTILITRKSFISELSFLPCLLIAHCLMFLMIRERKFFNWMIVAFCFKVTLILRVTLNIVLPCNLDNALLALPFILGGVQWRISTRDNKKKYNVIGIFYICINYVLGDQLRGNFSRVFY